MNACPDCHNTYTTPGGLTRHRARCPEAVARREAEIAAAGAPQVTYAVTNVTNISISVQITQQIVAAETPLFDAFLGRLLTIIANESAAWRGGADTARAKIREIRDAAAASPYPSDQTIGQWLSVNVIERDAVEGCDDAGMDSILDHTASQLQRIEDTALTVIKSYMPQQEKERLDQAFRDAPGLFAL